MGKQSTLFEWISKRGALDVQKAELSGDADFENNQGGSSQEIMHYIGLESGGDSDQGEHSFRREAERHSGMIPNIIGA